MKFQFEDYSDPRWQKKRLQIMKRDNFRCRRCDRDDRTLNVHHRYYQKGRKIWDYDDEALVTLCEKCHEKLHEVHNGSLEAITESFINSSIDTKLHCHKCNESLQVSDVAGRNGKHEPLCEKCCMKGGFY